MPSWLESVHQTWDQTRWLPAVISMRSKPQLLRADAELRARDWVTAAQGQGWFPELSAEVFAGVVTVLVQTAGDPPATPEEQALARAVVRGAVRDDDVIEQTEALARRLAPSMDAQLPKAPDDQERRGFRVLLAGVAALLALPHLDVLRLRMELPPAVTGAPDLLGERLQAAFDAPPAGREALLCDALDVAVTVAGPPPAVIPVLESLVYGGQPITPAGLRRCVAAMTAAAATVPDTGPSALARARNDSQASLFGVIGKQVDAADLGGEITGEVTQALEGMLKRDLSDRSRLSTGLNVARRWMQAGRLDRSDAILGQLREDIADPAADLRLAELEAQIRSRCGDRHGATAVLLSALSRASASSDVASRRSALLTLIGSWPLDLDPEAGAPRPGQGPGGEEIGPWIDEAGQLVDLDGPQEADQRRGQLMTALLALGCYEQAAAVRAKLDFAAWARTPGFNERLADVEQWSAREIAQAGAGGESGPPDPAGRDDAGWDYADLGRDGRSAEAAALAEARAQQALARGSRPDAYSYLAGAGHMYLRARDFPAALSAFDRAFALLEADLRVIPYPELVISRLADWPDRYHVAALAALEAGQPLRALSYAETGRARAVQGRLGPSAQRPAELPDSEEPAWQRFIALWRRGATEAAGELVSSGGRTGHPVSAGVADELTRLRRHFAARVAPSALSPVAPPVDAAEFPAQLAAAERPTAVLYSLIAWDQLRFIRVTAGGAVEIRLDAASRGAALAAIRNFAGRIHDAADPYEAVQAYLPALLEEAGPALEPALRQVTDGYRDGRLIWVPQGILAALPVQALPLAGHYVCDEVAVMTAESLAAAAPGLAPASPQPVRAAAIRGTSLAGAPTAGAAKLLPAGTEERFPEAMDDLSPALAGATLIYLSCHGRYDWRNPLSSALLFGSRPGPGSGFDLKIAELFDQIRIDPGAITILGTCDSGTIAQTDLNEGIGIPGGLLAAGARTVIGAGWPVARSAAIGVCRKLISALLDGAESPEALRDAACWLRDATAADLLAELTSIGHPAAQDLARMLPEDLAAHMFAEPVRWAAFLHWGAPWKAVASDS
jgi:CHAT domain